jgi:DNA-binding YbaB/EbfC family protein
VTVTNSGMPDMSALLAQAQAMQNQLLAAKEELASAQVTGSAASGLVSATVTGTGELVGLEIKPEAVDPADTETLADMVVAAVRDANQNAESLAAEKLGGATGGFGGDLGGGMPDLGDFFGPGGDDDQSRPSIGF